MSQRKSWSFEQDHALKVLYEKVKLNKWSLIAKQLQTEYNFYGRNGKQCRERYNNHLDPNLAKEEWTLEEEKKLYQLHDDLGNKWAIIANRIGGRTDNCVKNHFYSKLRKALRKLNKIIHEKYKKQIKQIKTTVIYKIIEASEQKFKHSPMCEAQTSQFCTKLKNQIIAYSYDDQQFNESKTEQNTKQLIIKINSFNKDYKRKPKKLRRVSVSYQSNTNEFLEVPTLTALQMKKSTSSSGHQDLDDSFNASGSNLSSDEDEIVRNNEIKEENSNLEQKLQTQQRKMIVPIIISQQNFGDKMVDEKQQEEYHESHLHGGIQQILLSSGILEDGPPLPPHPSMMKKQTSTFSDNHHDLSSEQFKFFDDSQIEMRILGPGNFQFPKKQSQQERLFH